MILVENEDDDDNRIPEHLNKDMKNES